MNNAAPCYLLGSYMSGPKFNQFADVMYYFVDCPKSEDNNATTDPRYNEITKDMGISYLDILRENKID